jgi:hypothetical protein
VSDPQAPNSPLAQLAPSGLDTVEVFRDARAQLASQPQRDQAGRFTAGNTEAGGTLTRSEQLWALVEPARRELTASVRESLGLDADASEVMLGLVENYAEARLLRQSLWASLIDRGGPVTAKGNGRRVLDAYWRASDRERDRAALLGLQRRAKRVDPLDAVRQAVAVANRQERTS